MCAHEKWVGLLVALTAISCDGGGAAAPSGEHHGTTVSSTLALAGHELWVVNQDADSVSVLDPERRALVAEIPLGDAPPAVDPATRRFDPLALPRALAIVDDAKVYVAAQAKNRVFVLDAATRAVRAVIPVPAAPVSVAAAPDGSAVYVVSHEAAEVTVIDPRSDTVTARVPVGEHPWGAAVSADGASLFVTHLLLDPGVTVIDTRSLAVTRKTPLADQPRGADKRIPSGVARGVYAVAPRPGSEELWVPHLLLAVETPQPDLDFESTVFPTISTLDATGERETRRLLFQPLSVPGAKGAFADSVSGPRAVAFTPDGKLALVAMAQSEDVMVFDAERGVEIGLVRPVPSALLEGIVIDPSGKSAYVEGRNTHDVTVLSIDAADALAPVRVEGAPIDRLQKDPMPVELRYGQRLFYSANSAAFPMTTNFWVACSSCHVEGGSDAVTWLFTAGPRDTPSNAGGPINTGFLLRQALRTSVAEYDETIRLEQGGHYHVGDPAQKEDLEALSAFVNYAIPFPQNPYLSPDGVLNERQKRGKTTFSRYCASCHSGPYLTDSAAGNPDLDLSKPIALHDVGTCVKGGPFPDRPAPDVAGNMHSACAFDTPTLRGVFATAPYFHDGSARTLRDVVDRLPYSRGLSEADKDDLVEYLKTL
jgi:YVTN family beta-propeller protein